MSQIPVTSSLLHFDFSRQHANNSMWLWLHSNMTKWEHEQKAFTPGIYDPSSNWMTSLLCLPPTARKTKSSPFTPNKSLSSNIMWKTSVFKTDAPLYKSEWKCCGVPLAAIKADPGEAPARGCIYNAWLNPLKSVSCHTGSSSWRRTAEKDPLCQLLHSTEGEETSKLEPAECVETATGTKTNLLVHGRPTRGRKKRHSRSVSLGHVVFCCLYILLLPVNSEIVELSCEIHSDQTVKCDDSHPAAEAHNITCKCYAWKLHHRPAKGGAGQRWSLLTRLNATVIKIKLFTHPKCALKRSSLFPSLEVTLTGEIGLIQPLMEGRWIQRLCFSNERWHAAPLALGGRWLLGFQENNGPIEASPSGIEGSRCRVTRRRP